MDTKIPTRTATTKFNLSIDLETYSSVDLVSYGVYRYVESPDFEILLFGYAFDGEDPIVVDFTSLNPTELKAWKKKISEWLTCGEYKLRAYNAEFEMACLSKWLGFEIPAEHWWDTQVTAATVGLPRSLKDVGIALGLDAESLKNPEGAALIRYFCVPCKPTGANGGRCRNRPSDAPDKWRRFIAYNKQDVIAERAIARKLARFEPSEAEHDAWILSVGINRRGVLCDRQMAENAVRISQEHTSLLMTELRQLTSLENPNSNVQLKEWLGLPDITKDTVTEALKTAEGDRKRVLELRRELGKTSIKKYEAMLGMMSPTDNRCRGVFSFYGANRTGRFTAKGIQLQNLPQNHINLLKEARDLVCQGDREGLEMLFGNVPDTLSQLIRTAFIAKPGHTFVVADFSAIEARVVAWLAGEKWRMDLFAAGGDIYCQSASKMFGVPVEKHGQNASLRQRGKVAELACIQKNSIVITDQGLVPIQNVTLDMKLWDGEEWVSHDGVVYRGKRRCISYGGLTATPDHVVFIAGREEPVTFEYAAANNLPLAQTGRDDGTPIRLLHGSVSSSGKDKEFRRLRTGKLQQMREDLLEESGESRKECQAEVPVLPDEAIPEVAGSPSDCCEAKMYESEGERVSEVRGTRDQVRVQECERSMPVCDEHAGHPGSGNGTGQDRHERELRSGESQICDTSGELCESAQECSESLRPSVLAVCELSGDQEAVCGNDQGRDHQGCGACRGDEAQELAGDSGEVEVYDIRNAGRHHRFTVSGVLVHNCGYGGGVGAMINMGGEKLGLSEEELKHIVDLWREASPHIVDMWWDFDAKAKRCVKRGISSETVHGITFSRSKRVLEMKLPSGRSLRYFDPEIGTGKFDKECIVYSGYEEGKWSKNNSYGPKLVENCTQAIARDCLVEAMKRVSKRYPGIVMHIHDEMVVEVPESEADEALAYMCQCMADPIPWAPGLLLRGDGYRTFFYRKD